MATLRKRWENLRSVKITYNDVIQKKVFASVDFPNQHISKSTVDEGSFCYEGDFVSDVVWFYWRQYWKSFKIKPMFYFMKKSENDESQFYQIHKRKSFKKKGQFANLDSFEQYQRRIWSQSHDISQKIEFPKWNKFFSSFNVKHTKPFSNIADTYNFLNQYKFNWGLISYPKIIFYSQNRFNLCPAKAPNMFDGTLEIAYKGSAKISIFALSSYEHSKEKFWNKIKFKWGKQKNESLRVTFFWKDLIGFVTSWISKSLEVKWTKKCTQIKAEWALKIDREVIIVGLVL